MTSQQVKLRETNLLKRDTGDPGSRNPGQQRHNKGTEGVGGHHEGVAERAEVGSITHFFSKDVAWVDGTQMW